MASPRSFWLTLVCAVCLVVFVVKIEGVPAGAEDKNSAKNPTKGAAAGASDESCDLDPEPEAEAEPTGNNKTNATKPGSERQGKSLQITIVKKDNNDKYNTTGHDGTPEPEPESEPNNNGTSPVKATNASLNNQENKSGQNGHGQTDNPTAGKSTANNATTTTTPSPSAGGRKSISSILSITALALLSMPIFL